MESAYARLGVQTAPRSTFRQVVAATLATGLLSQTQIVVAMREVRYDATMTPQALRSAVGAELQKDKAAFVRVDGKWDVRH